MSEETNNKRKVSSANKIGKKELAQAMVDLTGQTLKSATEQIENLLYFMEVSLKSSKEVVLEGIGKLKIVRTKERTGRNPSSGEKIMISEGKRLRFKKFNSFFDTSLMELLTGGYQKRTRKTKKNQEEE